ncbi:Cip1-interacting zinc finger protein [Galemys pyrenaicus]|uniref:Cip1-interacting zinc finger protein n=1 Tax=Galemys pyrenaicus TaxID=202257 RepID=A0A8J6A8S3_GALPY|nr:Cip1-interacting zinc finger protein [Galemys pyrenaicus]
MFNQQQQFQQQQQQLQQLQQQQLQQQQLQQQQLLQLQQLLQQSPPQAPLPMAVSRGLPQQPPQQPLLSLQGVNSASLLGGSALQRALFLQQLQGTAAGPRFGGSSLAAPCTDSHHVHSVALQEATLHVRGTGAGAEVPGGNLRGYNLATPTLTSPSLTPPQLTTPHLQQFFPQATRQSLLGPPPVGVPINTSQISLPGRTPQKQARIPSSTTPHRKTVSEDQSDPPAGSGEATESPADAPGHHLPYVPDQGSQLCADGFSREKRTSAPEAESCEASEPPAKKSRSSEEPTEKGTLRQLQAKVQPQARMTAPKQTQTPELLPEPPEARVLPRVQPRAPQTQAQAQPQALPQTAPADAQAQPQLQKQAQTQTAPEHVAPQQTQPQDTEPQEQVQPQARSQAPRQAQPQLQKQAQTQTAPEHVALQQTQPQDAEPQEQVQPQARSQAPRQAQPQLQKQAQTQTCPQGQTHAQPTLQPLEPPPMPLREQTQGQPPTQVQGSAPEPAPGPSSRPEGPPEAEDAAGGPEEALPEPGVAEERPEELASGLDVGECEKRARDMLGVWGAGGSLKVTILQSSDSRAFSTMPLTPGPRAGDATSATPTAASTPSKQTLQFFCYICRASCSSQQEFQDHMLGPQHQQRLGELQHMSQACLLSLLPVPRDVLERDEEPPPQRWCNTCQVYYVGDLIQHRRTQDHKIAKQSLRPFCTACNRYFKTPRKFVEHVKSQGHKDKTKELKMLEKEIAGQDEDHFITVDAVGCFEGDEEEEEEEEEEDEEEIEVEEEFCKQVRSRDISMEEWKGSETYSPNTAYGVDFLVPVMGYICRICRKFYHSNSGAQLSHCKSLAHFENLQKYKKAKNPSPTSRPVSRRCAVNARNALTALFASGGRPPSQLSTQDSAKTSSKVTAPPPAPPPPRRSTRRRN